MTVRSVFFASLCAASFGISMVSCTTLGQVSDRGILPVNTFDPKKNTIVFLGDSLTYGAGCSNPAEQSYPSLVQKAFVKRGLPYKVINAGISGDTTSGVLARMDPLLTDETLMVGLGIGVNDYHGEDTVDQIHERMRTIIKRILDKNIKVVLLKMEITFLGTNVPRFTAMYDELGKEFNIPVFEYMPASRLANASLFADKVHPNQNGHREIAGRLLAWLNPSLGDRSGILTSR